MSLTIYSSAPHRLFFQKFLSFYETLEPILRNASLPRLQELTIMMIFENLQVDGSAVYNRRFQVARRNSAGATGDAARYEKSVVLLLQAMRRNPVGQILLRHVSVAIAETGRQLVIAPWTVTDNAGGGADMRGLSSSQRTPIIQAAAVAGTSVSPTVIGTGAGTNALVLFDPRRFSNSLCGAGGQGDEVLFHELIHAKHAMQGNFNRSNADGNFTNSEEFGAVLVTDIYLASKGSMYVRNTHAFLTRASDPAARQAQLAAGVHLNSLFVYDFPGAPTQNAHDASTRVANDLQTQHHFRALQATDPRFFTAMAREAQRLPYNPIRDFLNGVPYNPMHYV